MARCAFVLELRPDAVSEYVRRHAEVPEGLLAVTRASGIRNYSIFVHGTRAFGYFEADDVEAVLSAGGSDAVVLEWQAEMARLRADGGTDLLQLVEVFHLD